MTRFANPLHNTVLVAKPGALGAGIKSAMCFLRTLDGETWDEAMARQAYPGCTTEWVRERWMKMEVV